MCHQLGGQPDQLPQESGHGPTLALIGQAQQLDRHHQVVGQRRDRVEHLIGQQTFARRVVQIQAAQHFLEQLLLAALEPVPRHDGRGVRAFFIARDKGVTPKHFALFFPAGGGQIERADAVLGRVPQARVLLRNARAVAPDGLAFRTPNAGRQRRRRALGHSGPLVVTDAPMGEARGGDGLQITGAAGAAVGQKIALPSRPQRPVPFQHRGQRPAHVTRSAQLSIRQKRPEPHRLPGERQVPVVIDLRAFEAWPKHFDLRVVEKDFRPPAVSPPCGVGPRQHPVQELPDQLPQAGHARRRLFAQPFAHLGLVGELFYPRQLAHQRFGIEPFGVGQAGPAGAETINQLRHHQFGAVTVRAAGARIQTGDGPELFPEAKLLGQRFQRGQTAQRAVVAGGDKLQSQLGRALANLSHVALTQPGPTCSIFSK